MKSIHIANSNSTQGSASFIELFSKEANERFRYVLSTTKFLVDRSVEEKKVEFIGDDARDNLMITRFKAVEAYNREFNRIQDKYLIESFEDYDPKKGDGISLTLLFVDDGREISRGYPIMSTLKVINENIKSYIEEERRVFIALKLKHPETPRVLVLVEAEGGYNEIIASHERKTKILNDLVDSKTHKLKMGKKLITVIK